MSFFNIKAAKNLNCIHMTRNNKTFAFSSFKMC